MPAYLLTCDCGHQIVVDTSDAGNSVTCPQCEASVRVPSFSELKRLPLASQSEAKPVGRQPTDVVRNLGGVLILLSLLLLPVLIYIRSTLLTGITPQQAISHYGEVIDHLTPLAAWDLWTEYSTNGIGPRQLTWFHRERRWELVLNVLIGLASLMTLTGIAMAVRGGRRKQPSR